MALDGKTNYDNHSKEFSEFADKSFSWQFLEKPAFNKYIGDMYRPDITVLDIGCGTGRVIAHLVSNGVKPENITGLDPSDEMLVLAAKRDLGVSLIKGTATKLPFPDESFDLIVSNMVIHELNSDQLPESLAEASRVLRPNGVFFFVDAHPLSTPEKVSNVGKWINQKTPWGKDVKCFVHNFDLLANKSFTHGLELEYSGTLEVQQDGQATNPQEYQRYLSRPSRFAGKLVKV